MSDASDSGSGDESILNSGSSGIDGAQGGTDSDSYSDEIPFQTPKTKKLRLQPQKKGDSSKRARGGELETPKRPNRSATQISAADSSAIMSKLTEVTKTLGKVVKRLDRNESRIHSVEQKMTSKSSASMSRKVPAAVRVSNHDRSV